MWREREQQGRTRAAARATDAAVAEWVGAAAVSVADEVAGSEGSAAREAAAAEFAAAAAVAVAVAAEYAVGPCAACVHMHPW